MRKTIIYILISFILVLLGLVLIFAFENNSNLVSIATSILGGGIASLGFSLIRFFDDYDSNTLDTKIENLYSLIQLLQGKMLISNNPDYRCIYDRQITKEFDSLIDSIKTDEKIEIDIVGLSLQRFYKEQLEKLLQKNKIKLRIVIQDPRSSFTRQMINQEKRSETEIIKDIQTLTKKNLYLNKKEFQLKWLDGISNLTMVRINDVIFVRSRVLDEGIDAPVLYEKYTREHENAFKVFDEYFKNIWNLAKFPSKK